jgi:hypothetical protein
MSEKQQQQQEQKPSYEGKNKKPSTAEVSLDKADTVIEGGPLLLRHVTPLTRRHVVYFCSGAFSRRHNTHVFCPHGITKDLKDTKSAVMPTPARKPWTSQTALFDQSADRSRAAATRKSSLSWR